MDVHRRVRQVADVAGQDRAGVVDADEDDGALIVDRDVHAAVDQGGQEGLGLVGGVAAIEYGREGVVGCGHARSVPPGVEAGRVRW